MDWFCGRFSMVRIKKEILGTPIFVNVEERVKGLRESDGTLRDIKVFDLEHHFLRKQKGFTKENLPLESFKVRPNDIVLLKED
jgi:hypothetical protein